MDETGLLADEDEVEEELVDYLDEDENGSCIWLTDTVKITQADIRKLQLAKASIAAGIRILLSEKGLQMSEVEQVILAGGFGSFLNKKSAAAIGLIPGELLDVTVSVGKRGKNLHVFRKRCDMWNCLLIKNSVMNIWNRCILNNIEAWYIYKCCLI